MLATTVEAPTKRPIPLHKDVGKAVNDLFTKGFPSTYKFELTTAVENGLKFITSVERKPKEFKDDSGGKVKRDIIFATFQPKIELKERGVSFTGTIDSEKLVGELALSNFSFAKGFKTTFKATANDDNTQELSGEVEYRNEAAASTLALVYKDMKSRVDFASVFGYQSTNFGGAISYALPVGDGNEGSLESYTITTNWVTDKFDLANSFGGKRDKNEFKYNIGAKLLYNHSASATFAADLNHDPAKSLGDFSLKLLGSYKFDENASLKGKVDTQGNIGLAFSQKAYNSLTLTVATELSALKVDEHKVGFSLAFSP